MSTPDDPTQLAAWQRGAQRARDDMAKTPPPKPDVPVSYTAASCSILASPYLGQWPDAVDTDLDPIREWLWAKATRWPKGMEHPVHGISRTDLGLSEGA